MQRGGVFSRACNGLHPRRHAASMVEAVRDHVRIKPSSMQIGTLYSGMAAGAGWKRAWEFFFVGQGSQKRAWKRFRLPQTPPPLLSLVDGRNLVRSAPRTDTGRRWMASTVGQSPDGCGRFRATAMRRLISSAVVRLGRRKQVMAQHGDPLPKGVRADPFPA